MPKTEGFPMKCFFCENDVTGYAMNANTCKHCFPNPVYFFNAVKDIIYIEYYFNGCSISYSLKHEQAILVNTENFKVITNFKDREITSPQRAQSLLNKFLKLKAFL